MARPRGDNYYQVITVTLSDGRKGYFTGPAVVFQKDCDAGIKLVKTEWGKPRRLPKGSTFKPIVP
jgi:hypothetical protein